MAQQWFCHVAGTTYGPYSFNQLKQFAQQGQIKADCLVSTDQQSWFQVWQIPELALQCVSAPAIRNDQNPAAALAEISSYSTRRSHQRMKRKQKLARITAAVVLSVILAAGAIFGTAKLASKKSTAVRLRSVPAPVRELTQHAAPKNSKVIREAQAVLLRAVKTANKIPVDEAHSQSKLEILRDVAIAQSLAADIEGAMSTARLIRECRTAADLDFLGDFLPHADVANRFIAIAQAKTGDLSAALKTLQLTKSADQRVQGLCAIATIQNQAQNQVAARRILEQAFGAAGKDDWALQPIAIAQSRIGDFKASFVTLNRVAEFLRRPALRQIVAAEAAAGHMAEAIRDARAIPDGTEFTELVDKACALFDLAVLEARAGHMASADTLLSESRQIARRSPLLNDESLEAVSNEMERRGDSSEALRLATAITNGWLRARALCKLAVGRHSAGDPVNSTLAIATAVQGVDDATSPTQQERIVCLVGIAYAHIGNLDGSVRCFNAAIRIANRREEPAARNLDLQLIAMDQARAGLFKEALQIVRGINDSRDYTDFARLQVVLEQVRSGDCDDAMHLAEMETDPRFQSKMYLQIALGLVESKGVEVDPVEMGLGTVHLFSGWSPKAK